MNYVYSIDAQQTRFPFILPKLNFNKEDFGNCYSVETFDYHYQKHHLTYVNNLNNLITQNSEFDDKSLEDIIISSFSKNQAIFNNAAQVWNHSFFWNSITPKGGGMPNQEIEKLLIESFGSVENFQSEFIKNALSQFGSGWVWLVLKENKLEIVKTSNAENTISNNPELKPIITCDVWEHAYYIDYRNRRNEFVKLFLENMINWDFAYKQLKNS